MCKLSVESADYLTQRKKPAFGGLFTRCFAILSILKIRSTLGVNLIFFDLVKQRRVVNL